MDMTKDLASVTSALEKVDRVVLEAAALAAAQQHIRSCELVASSHHEEEHSRQAEHADERTIRARIAALSTSELAAYVAPLALAAEVLDSTD
jgi:hypothetical protein